MSSNPSSEWSLPSVPIVGIVSQIRGALTYLTMTPGVSFTNGSDDLGQLYRAREKVDSDIIIVGRAITQSANVVTAALAMRGKL